MKSLSPIRGHNTFARIYAVEHSNANIKSLSNSAYRLYYELIAVSSRDFLNPDTSIQANTTALSNHFHRVVHDDDLEQLVSRHLVSVSPGNTIMVNDWHIRQVARDVSRYRMRAYRSGNSNDASLLLYQARMKKLKSAIPVTTLGQMYHKGPWFKFFHKDKDYLGSLNDTTFRLFLTLCKLTCENGRGADTCVPYSSAYNPRVAGIVSSPQELKAALDFMVDTNLIEVVGQNIFMHVDVWQNRQYDSRKGLQNKRHYAVSKTAKGSVITAQQDDLFGGSGLPVSDQCVSHNPLSDTYSASHHAQCDTDSASHNPLSDTHSASLRLASDTQSASLSDIQPDVNHLSANVCHLKSSKSVSDKEFFEIPEHVTRQDKKKKNTNSLKGNASKPASDKGSVDVGYELLSDEAIRFHAILAKEYAALTNLSLDQKRRLSSFLNPYPAPNAIERSWYGLVMEWIKAGAYVGDLNAVLEDYKRKHDTLPNFPTYFRNAVLDQVKKRLKSSARRGQQVNATGHVLHSTLNKSDLSARENTALPAISSDPDAFGPADKTKDPFDFLASVLEKSAEKQKAG